MPNQSCGFCKKDSATLSNVIYHGKLIEDMQLHVQTHFILNFRAFGQRWRDWSLGQEYDAIWQKVSLNPWVPSMWLMRRPDPDSNSSHRPPPKMKSQETELSRKVLQDKFHSPEVHLK